MSERLQTVFRHLQGSNNGPIDGRIVYNPTATLATSSLPDTLHYNFTYGGKKLTPSQRQFYEENGFLVIKNVVPSDKLEVYRQRFKGICNGQVPKWGMTLMRDVAIAKSEFKDGERAINKLQDFQWDDVLFSYCSLPEVLGYVEDFIGPNIMAAHTMLINKPPDPGTLTSRHPMHQDLYYFPFRPANRVVCSWTAMQLINRSNGCLVVIPGSHKSELMDHDYPNWEGGVNKMYHGVTNYNPEEHSRVWVEMDEGDTVFFHPLLIHGSGANRTDGFRKSISCHYAASECQYIETEGSKHEKIAKEVVSLVEKRTGIKDAVPYQDVWRFRARLVHGEQINI